MAVAWATLVHVGECGYRRSANAITDATEVLKAAITEIPNLELCGDPTCAVVPICGKRGMNVYALSSLMDARGWSCFTGQKPATLAIPVGEHTPGHLQQLIDDLKDSAAYLATHPDTKPTGNAAVYGAAATIPDEILEAVLRGYVDVKLTVKKATAHANNLESDTRSQGLTKRAAKSPVRK